MSYLLSGDLETSATGFADLSIEPDSAILGGGVSVSCQIPRLFPPIVARKRCQLQELPSDFFCMSELKKNFTIPSTFLEQLLPVVRVGDPIFFGGIVRPCFLLEGSSPSLVRIRQVALI